MAMPEHPSPPLMMVNRPIISMAWRSAEGTHGTDPRPYQDQHVTDPATDTREKGTAKKRKGGGDQ